MSKRVHLLHAPHGTLCARSVQPHSDPTLASSAAVFLRNGWDKYPVRCTLSPDYVTCAACLAALRKKTALYQRVSPTP